MSETTSKTTLLRLFITRFHSPREFVAKTFEGKKHRYTEKEIRYDRERLTMDREFSNAEQARKWVTDQKSGNRPTDPDFQWCELWGEPVPVSDAPACERAKLEFERYEEQYFPGF